FIGDGVMALFGLHSDPGRACRDALRAAVGMAAALDRLNETLAAALGEPLKIGIGIHVGPAIVGGLGYRRAMTLTEVGAAVDTASRSESLTKERESQVVLSEAVAERARVDSRPFPEARVEIRGRVAPLLVRAIPRAADLLPVLDAPPFDGLGIVVPID